MYCAQIIIKEQDETYSTECCKFVNFYNFIVLQKKTY